MPMTPQGPARCSGSGEYVQTLICRGMPRCARRGAERQRAQDEDCGMCERIHEYRMKEAE